MKRKCELVGGGSMALSRKVRGVEIGTGEVVEIIEILGVAQGVAYTPKQLDDKGADKECLLRGEIGQRVADFAGCVSCKFSR